MSRKNIRSRLGAAIMVALAGGLLAIIPTAPAIAHDQLIASDPADGEKVVEAPSSVTLQYSAELMDLGAAMLIVDAEGTDWANGDPMVRGDSVTIGAEPDMPEGAYEIRWQVVSSDGHPISGVVPFGVGLDSPDAIPGTDPTSTPADTSVAAPTSPVDPSALVRVIVVAGVGAGVAVLALVLVTVIRRRRRDDGTADASS